MKPVIIKNLTRAVRGTSLKLPMKSCQYIGFKHLAKSKTRLKDGNLISNDQYGFMLSAYYGDSLLATAPLFHNDPLELQMKLVDFELEFLSKENGKAWVKLYSADANELGFPPAGRFTGSFGGLYATSSGDSSDNVAVYENYKMEEIKDVAP